MAKILLVDDDRHTRTLLFEFLQHAGHEVIFAQDGAFGVSMSELERPDLILLDLMMPVMDGPQALNVLKSKPELADIPVVVISANNSVRLKQEVLDAGAIAFFDKPIELKALLTSIEGTLTFRSKTARRA